jgi:hypothetical protein
MRPWRHWKVSSAIVAIGLAACSIANTYGDHDTSRDEEETLQTKGPVGKDSGISCEAKNPEVTADSQSIKDFFPWPPPQASDEDNITDIVRKAIRWTPTSHLGLGNIDKFLERKLESVGLKQISYFSTPDHNGYVSVTRLEQIDERGRSLDSDEASKGPIGLGEIMWQILKGTINLPAGKFRLLMFFVTTEDINAKDRLDDVTMEDADRWLKGCGGLPRALATRILSKDVSIFIRVYEINSRGGDGHLVRKGENPISLSRQLTALGLTLDNQK